MSLDYAQLLDLASVDDEIAHLGETFRRSPARRLIQELGVERLDLLKRLATTSGAIGELDQETAELSSESKLHEQKLRSLNAAEGADKGVSYRNVEVLAHEIALVRERLDEIELRQLEIIESFEELSGDQDELTSQLADLEGAIRDAELSLANESTAYDSEIARLNQVRDPLANQIPEGFVDSYNRLLASKSGRAFAYVDQGKCAGCQLKVSALELTHIKQAVTFDLSGYPRCEGCDRILLLPGLRDAN